jgi:hypothetical protein
MVGVPTKTHIGHLLNTRAIWKVTSSELLTKQAIRGEKNIIYKKYACT